MLSGHPNSSHQKVRCISQFNVSWTLLEHDATFKLVRIDLEGLATCGVLSPAFHIFEGSQQDEKHGVLAVCCICQRDAITWSERSIRNKV